MGVPGPWYERLPHFRMGFTPSSGKELQSEYFVPRKDAVDAILAIERLRDRVSPHLLISELRTVDADGLWMSPCYQRPSLAIHFTWKPDWDSVRKLLPSDREGAGPLRGPSSLGETVRHGGRGACNPATRSWRISRACSGSTIPAGSSGMRS